MSQQHPSKQVKIVILGDSGVGKSSIMLRFVTESFQDESEPTLGGAFMTKLVTINGESIKYQIWDTAGQEKYHSLAPMYYKDAQVAVLVFDITNGDSFESLKKWKNELKENGPKDLILAVVGNKIDLIGQEKVSIETGEKFSKNLGAIFKTCSAKNDKGINELFDSIGDELFRNHIRQDLNETIKLNEPIKIEETQNGGCCSK